MWTVIVASGPSLTQADMNYCHDSPCHVIVVNDAWRLAPWADVLYACDLRWIEHYRGVPEFMGQKWTTDPVAAQRYKWNWIVGEWGNGLSLDPRKIHYGHNSGYQALNLAVVRFNAKKIILLGYDMKSVNGKQHFFGDHPEGVARPSPYSQFIKNFRTTLPDLKHAGVEVVNCTIDSALDCFKIGELRKVLQ